MALLDSTASWGHIRDGVTQPVWPQFYESTLEMVDLMDDPDCPRAEKHRELEKAEVKKGKEAVQHIITACQRLLKSIYQCG